MIPKLLHYVWIGPYEDERCYINSWEDNMPDYKIIRWDNNSASDYIKEAVNLLGNVEGKSFTYISDLVRLLIIRDHGGIYLDHDMCVIKDFTNLLDCELVLTFQYDPADGVFYKFSRGKNLKELLDTEYGLHQCYEATVNNCFIASVPRHKFINKAIELTLANHTKPIQEQYAMSDWGVGPDIFTEASQYYGFKTQRCETQVVDDMKILHRKHLHPTHGLVRYIGKEVFEKEIEQAMSNTDTYVIHMHVNAGGRAFVDGTAMMFSTWYNNFNELQS